MIRPARPDDLLACLLLSRAGFGEEDRPTARWWVRQLAAPGAVLLVYEEQGRVQGGCLFRPGPGGSTRVRLLFVAPWRRRRGIGRQLVRAVGGPRVALVREGNRASRALFDRLGWTAVPSGEGWVEYQSDPVARPEQPEGA